MYLGEFLNFFSNKSLFKENLKKFRWTETPAGVMLAWVRAWWCAPIIPSARGESGDSRLAGRWLSAQAWRPEFGSLIHVKRKLDMCLCNPSTGGRRERRRQILGTFWPASLAKMVSSRISERALHKEMMRKETGRDAWCAQSSRKTHQAYPHRTHNKWTDRWTEEDTSSHRTAMDGWMDE